VQLLGGQVEIQSAPGEGTQVIASLPARIVECEGKVNDEPACRSNPSAS
jgi:hypothetical protein